MSEFTLSKQDVHIWYASLALTASQETELRQLLSPDELKRADRFRFPIHRQHYIAARSLLRRILSHYLDINPEDIHFSYYVHGKPYLENSTLQFNVSHSHDRAVFALTEENPIGVDIEKIRATYTESVAKRYFSEAEYTQLSTLPSDQQVVAFYRIWARKEALIKAIGEGLRFPLSQFSVSINNDVEDVVLDYQGKTTLHVESFTAHPDYQSAFATQQQVSKVIVREWLSDISSL